MLRSLSSATRRAVDEDGGAAVRGEALPLGVNFLRRNELVEAAREASQLVLAGINRRRPLEQRPAAVRCASPVTLQLRTCHSEPVERPKPDQAYGYAVDVCAAPRKWGAPETLSSERLQVLALTAPRRPNGFSAPTVESFAV